MNEVNYGRSGGYFIFCLLFLRTFPDTKRDPHKGDLFLIQEIDGAASVSSSNVPFRSWSVIAQTEASDQTFSAVSIISMIV